MSESASGRRRQGAGYDPLRTRAGLITSGLELFAAHGFDRTSLQDIVEGAHLTKGAFYHHFDSKEDLLFRLQDEHLDIQIGLANAITTAEPDAVQRVRALIRLSLVAVADHRSYVAIFQQERRHLTGDRSDQIARKRDDLDAIYRGAVQAAMDTGQFRSDVSAQVATYGIAGMCAWAFQWFKSDGRLGVDEIADQFCALILEGLLAG